MHCDIPNDEEPHSTPVAKSPSKYQFQVKLILNDAVNEKRPIFVEFWHNQPLLDDEIWVLTGYLK